CAGGITGLDYW
nr:immunoglobulin heavy chain junction region [Macaca mulatta]MOW46353.1 immunoglobulin heavy chain junction region [Macaca mulatta]MOW46897.1 immunoglobulin heavy chain junction region [Macaca mulatta]MOW47723.1 immunoglobulin heavy chain junction region [Macaca mulatta]MOW47769.1 immunoglobulin heavy chain junction region [Macaca mulatta]